MAYVTTTKGEETKGLGGTLCRGEFFQVILRLCNQIYPKRRIAPHLQEFIDVYFRGVFEKSLLLRDRALIRASRNLNNLLQDNEKGLEIIFDSYLVRDKFSF
mmetsp:Transcript_34104/g.52385  ORF Transcript_34104/g.52385 Transcript_34104/m.52385 type:complete len:102 (-) Transcript_34104:459-764(-)